MEFRRESFQMDHPAARGQESRAMEGEEKWASAAFVPRAKLRRACPSEARVSLPEGLFFHRAHFSYERKDKAPFRPYFGCRYTLL